MTTIFKNLLQIPPRTLFLIDASGALITTFSLLVVLKSFPEYFRMPHSVLTYLAIIGAVLCIYSTSCFLLLKQNRLPFLRAIGIANSIYCFLTLSLVVYHFQNLSIWDIAYFFMEILVVTPLVYLELTVSENKES